MTKIFALLFVALTLAGCGAESNAELLVHTKYKVLTAPAAMYVCPSIGQLPKFETLTDIQVAEVLLKQAQARDICAASLSSIKRYLAEAKKKFES